MNTSKLIARLRKTRKLMPICIHHNSAKPSVRLCDKKFSEALPFLSCLFKTLRKYGYSIDISPWGQVIAYSVTKQVAVMLVLEKPNPFMASVKNNLHNLETSDFEILTAIPTTGSVVLKYFYYDTKSIWRNIDVMLNQSCFADLVESIISKIIKNGEQFEGRVEKLSPQQDSILTIEDIMAFARFASLNLPAVQAWRGVYKTFAEDYVDSFQCTDEFISLKISYSGMEKHFYFNSADIKFIQRYTPEFPKTLIFRG